MKIVNIKSNSLLPITITDIINSKVFMNVLMAIFIMCFYIFLNWRYSVIEEKEMELNLKVFSMIGMIIGIIIIEIAYRKDKFETSFFGLEFILLAGHVLSLMHVITFYNFNFQYYVLTSSYFFAIYFVLKSMFIYTIENRKYLKSLSDISDIVKKDSKNMY